MTTLNQYNPQIVFHPGETLEEKLEELGMGPKEFALRTGKPEKTITAILKGESSITPEMAVKFENVLQIPAHFWLKSQRAFDEYQARLSSQESLPQSIDWMKKFPVRAMINCGWFPEARKNEEKASNLLRFFGFSSHQAWEDYYYKQQLKVAFRISLAHTKEPFALSAWLRKGELQAAQIQITPFDKKKFKNSIEVLKQLMVEQSKDCFNQLQEICRKSGVKVVYTPCLPKAPINGATRWMNDSPLIQLSNRHKRNDIFWFTFFHEVGHILLHGKKDIFLEDIEYSEKDAKKEAEADEFAIECTFTKEQEEELLSQNEITPQDIINSAKKFKTHPAMIVGRLQKKNIIPYSEGREFMISIEINE